MPPPGRGRRRHPAATTGTHMAPSSPSTAGSCSRPVAVELSAAGGAPKTTRMAGRRRRRPRSCRDAKAACRNRRRHGHHGCARTPHMAPCGDLPIVAARAAVAPRSATDDGNACRVHQARASLVCRARRTPRYAACPHTERASPLAPLTRAAGKGSKCGQVLRGAVCSQPERHRQAHHLLGAGGAPAAVDSSPPRRRAEQCPVMHWSKVASIADEDHDRGSQRAS